MTSVILASSSPYRQTLLRRLGIDFTTQAPEVDETPLPGEAPPALAERLARKKAQEVAKQCTGPGLVIGADQVAVRDGRLLGKPGTREACIAQLLASAGRRVIFHTGLCVFNRATGQVRAGKDSFSVVFRPLDRPRIEAYTDRERPFDCAGGAEIRGHGHCACGTHGGQ